MADANLNVKQFYKKILQCIKIIRHFKKKKVTLQQILNQLNKGTLDFDVSQLKRDLEIMEKDGMIYKKGTGRQASYFICNSTKLNVTEDSTPINDKCDVPEDNISNTP